MEIVVDEITGGISRREALKTTAKVAGAAAFAAPVVVGIFSSSASAATCSTTNDSDAVEETIVANTITWNTNCAGGGAGNYLGQDKSSFFIDGAEGFIQLGENANDNFAAEIAYYKIEAPAGYTCNVPEADGWAMECTGTVAWSVPLVSGDNIGRVPFCSACASAKLILLKVVCCPSISP